MAAAARAVSGRLCGALLPLPRPLPLPRRGLSGRPAGTLARGGRSSQNARPRREPGIPRTEKMEVDQDWTSVYPAAAAFKPSAVPLPVRMGYPVKRGVPPAKEGNLELLKNTYSFSRYSPHNNAAWLLLISFLKRTNARFRRCDKPRFALTIIHNPTQIPNFLHLTPVAIRKHCAALKDFYTEWPPALDNDEKCLHHFPIEVDTVDFVSAGTSIRNPKARMVTLRVKLSSLNLDDHAKKKLIKLVGERYCKGTDTLTITTDRCPLKRQNYDYGVYLLTVLFHESWKTEHWEGEKTVADMEEYVWEDSPSESHALATLSRIRSAEEAKEASREELLASPLIQEYRKSVEVLKNEGETEKNICDYKNSVKRLLNLNAL